MLVCVFGSMLTAWSACCKHALVIGLKRCPPALELSYAVLTGAQAFTRAGPNSSSVVLSLQ